jgi:hypothetical protein
MSGYELSERLFEDYNIEDERTNEKSTMLLCGVGTTKKMLQSSEPGSKLQDSKMHQKISWASAL